MKKKHKNSTRKHPTPIRFGIFKIQSFVKISSFLFYIFFGGCFCLIRFPTFYQVCWFLPPTLWIWGVTLLCFEQDIKHASSPFMFGSYYGGILLPPTCENYVNMQQTCDLFKSSCNLIMLSCYIISVPCWHDYLTCWHFMLYIDIIMSTYFSCILIQFILHVWDRRMLLVFQNLKIFYEISKTYFCIQIKSIFTKHSLNQRFNHYVFLSKYFL